MKKNFCALKKYCYNLDMPEIIVELRNVKFIVGGLQILSDLNLQIEKGGILILLGESG